VCQRLETRARPDRLLIGPATYQAVAGQFNIQAVGPMEVKGRTRPVDTYEVMPEPVSATA
jgi:class 3 adenylate cyclase